jgi:hypothetical protein
MSLEQALADNTAAVKELIGVWSKLVLQGKSVNAQVDAGEVTTVTAGNVKIPVAAPKPAAAAEPVASAVKESAPATASSPVVTPAPTDSPAEIPYEVVSKAITDMVKADRAKVVATLAQFSVAKGTQLTADQYADFLKALAS